MKISDLKQPYRRMAEYLAEKSTEECYHGKKDLDVAFGWYQTNVKFWSDIDDGDYPPITEEIKKHFPADFDFSGEEYSICYAYNENDLSNDFKISYKKNYDYTMEEFYKAKKRVEEKEKHTQLAKEGKFDNLPATCEFSEAVELEVWDDVILSERNNHHTRLVIGKFKNLFIAEPSLIENKYTFWKHAQLPTPEIDFSQFNPGDILEITNKDNEKYYGLLYLQTINELVITLSYNSKSSRHILKDNILSISKLK